jgi:hypothetical protein
MKNMKNVLFNIKSVKTGTLVPKLWPEPAPEPKLFESRSRSGNKEFRLHNTDFKMAAAFLAIHRDATTAQSETN